MGIWGPKLYQGDTAQDVRDFYKDQLHRGKEGIEITELLIAQNEDLLQDVDEAAAFWLALADTQWKLGRLEARVKENALRCLADGSAMRAWEAAPAQTLAVRRKALAELERELQTPQPPPKRVRQYKLYHCPWKIGDVFAYRFPDELEQSEYGGKYLFFVKVDNGYWHPGHTIPLVYVYWTICSHLLTLDEVRELHYMPQFFTPDAYQRNPARKRLYLLGMITTSTQSLPRKQLTHIGNLGSVNRVPDESMEPYHVAWRDFARYSADIFGMWGDKEF